jgi:hypothetical protein
MDVGRALGLGVVVLAAAVAVGGVASADLTGGPAQQRIDADTVSLRVSLQAEGTATWEVTYRLELADRNATEAFESLRTDIDADPGPYIDRFESRMRRAMWTAENATGREMSVGNASVEARVESLPQGEYGVVVYRLDWAGFAAADGGTLRAGDAIDAFFLDSRTSLTVAWPDGGRLVDHEPTATAVENGSLTWEGRRDFGPGEPRIAVSASPATGETPGAGGPPLFPLAVVVAIVLATGGWLSVRRGRTDDRSMEARADAAAESSPAEGRPPPELLSNEEHVLGLLEGHGGRLKTQQVAAELDWTDAKTSQVVSGLREAGELDSFRLGRENVLTLPAVSLEGDAGDGEGAGGGAGDDGPTDEEERPQ